MVWHYPGCPVAVRALGKSAAPGGAGQEALPSEQEEEVAVGCVTSQCNTLCSELQVNVLTACLDKARAVLFVPRCSGNIHSPFNPFSLLATFRIGFEAEQGTGEFSLLNTATSFPPRTAYFN